MSTQEIDPQKSAMAWLSWEADLGGSLPITPSDGRDTNESGMGVSSSEEAHIAPTCSEQIGPHRLPTLKTLAEQASECNACALHKGRTRSVFSRGSADARLAFVGEGPGFHEDKTGTPFVGKAGQLLDKMIGAMGFDPEDVYVCNVVKCRPPDNRTPLPDEVAKCLPYLQQQLKAVRPAVVVALGRTAAVALGVADPEGGPWRGRWGSYDEFPVMPTYHPAFLLRNPERKRTVWEDLQLVMQRLKDLP